MAESAGWSGLIAPEGFLVPGGRAPVPVPRETAASYRSALVRLLESSSPELVRKLEAGLSTASTLLEGAQELLVTANELVAPGKSVVEVRHSAESILRILGALLRQENSAYALRQMAELLESAVGSSSDRGSLQHFPRVKDLLGLLDGMLERIRLSGTMEPDRLGKMLVHLDELYDDACLQLQRFYSLSALRIEEARQLAPEVLRRFHDQFARASIADHVLASSEKQEEPGSGTGLLQLLPELIQALEAAG
jgi:hypothetical protein